MKTHRKRERYRERESHTARERERHRERVGFLMGRVIVFFFFIIINPTKGPSRDYPDLVLGAVTSFLEPFGEHVLPKVDKSLRIDI